MSAFVVTDETINRILYLATVDRRGVDNLRWRGVNLLPLDDPACVDPLTDLGNRLRALNVAAVRTRYADGAAEMIGSDGPRRFNAKACSRVVAYKALQCWLYQCSEGDVPETPLFKQMDTLRNDIAADIVADLPAYSAAEWG